MRRAAGVSSAPGGLSISRSSPIRRPLKSSVSTDWRRSGGAGLPRWIAPSLAPNARAAWLPSVGSTLARSDASAIRVANDSLSRASAARRAASSRSRRTREARLLVTAAVTTNTVSAAQSLDELITSVCAGGRKKKLNASAAPTLVVRPHHRPYSDETTSTATR